MAEAAGRQADNLPILHTACFEKRSIFTIRICCLFSQLGTSSLNHAPPTISLLLLRLHGNTVYKEFSTLLIKVLFPPDS